jgi:hypothetical protein
VERNRKAGQNPPRDVAPVEEEEEGDNSTVFINMENLKSVLQ